MSSAGLPSIWCLSIMWTKVPFLNKAMLGEEGGKGINISLAPFVASVSTPAKTVTKLAFYHFEEINELQALH